MTGKGSITRASQSKFRVLLLLQIAWIGVVCLLGGWWGHLVTRQAARIADLEKQVGVSSNAAELQLLRTHRMLYWESGVFVLFLIASILLLLWLYWRDQKRAEGIRAFFASVTHELRTPLTSMRLQAESIAEAIAVSPGKIDSQKHLVQRLLEDTTRLEAQVERTLELARVEGGGPVFTQPINLKLLIDRSVKSWATAYEQKIVIENLLGDLEVRADVGAVQVIMKNLLDNSIRHSKRDPVRVYLKAERDGDQITVCYRDNGESISENSKKLGALFEKGSASQGAGVGLYLIKTLMERMGGKALFSGIAGFEVRLCFKGGDPHRG